MIYIAINICLLLWVSGKMLYFNFDTNINTPPFRWKIHKKSVQAMLASGMVLVGIFSLLRLSILWMIFSLVMDALLFADALYMRYYKNPLTASVVLHQIKLLKGIRNSVFGVFLKKDMLYFIDLPLEAILLIILERHQVSGLFCFIFSGFCILAGAIWFSYIYQHSNRKSYFWNKKRIARDLGILYYHINDLLGYLNSRLHQNKNVTSEEIKCIRDACWRRTVNAYSGKAKGKNLIVVQMESMQEFLRDRVIEGKEITPNLNQLSRECVRFDQMYYQTSVGNTSDAELVLNNSLYPLSDKPACYECQNNVFHSIGHAAKKKGYYNLGAHGNQASFWNRHLMYRLYGYDSFIDNSMLKNDEFIFPGLSDSSFYRQMTDILEEKSRSGLFYAFLISLSLHHPYDYFEKDDFPVGDLEGTFLGRYIKGAHYADQAIGEFIQHLKKKGLYDNTLLVMYGDHSGVPRQYRQELMDYLGLENTEQNWMKQSRVVSLMRFPEQSEAVRIQKVVGQIDLLPTIANIMDFDIGYALGNDIFDDQYAGGIINREGVVVTEKYIYFPNQEKAFDLHSGKEVELTQKDRDEIKVLQNKLQISDIILEKNAFHTMVEEK